jgi:hypothetical protein
MQALREARRSPCKEERAEHAASTVFNRRIREVKDNGDPQGRRRSRCSACEGGECKALFARCGRLVLIVRIAMCLAYHRVRLRGCEMADGMQLRAELRHRNGDYKHRDQTANAWRRGPITKSTPRGTHRHTYYTAFATASASDGRNFSPEHTVVPCAWADGASGVVAD